MRLDELATLIGGELRGPGEQEVAGVAGLGHATASDISYINSAKHVAEARESLAMGFLVGQFIDDMECPQIKVEDPELAFAGLLERLRPRPEWPPGISEHAFVDPSAELATDVSVMPFAYIAEGASLGPGSVVCPGVFIGRNTRVGQDCLLYPNVTLMDGVRLMDRVTVHSGSVIGSDGYGYLQRGGQHIKIPQVGGVIIEDDVEIGGNCSIDRSTTANTVIGKGTKLDNLVHIAHNVTVGEGGLLTAQVGIAGSTKVGKYVVMAGQSGIKDHVTVADNTVLAAKAGVITDIKEGGMYAGMPSMPVGDWLRASAAFARLPELMKKLRRLEKRLEQIENKGSE